MSAHPSEDPFNLQRFVTAQSLVFDKVASELRAGRKRTHWMWFVFPQAEGLGFSSTSRKFAICSLEEVEAYLSHDVLGPRLTQCTRLVLLSGRHASEVFGYPDDLKFRSCMTLFSHVSPEPELFIEALVKCCGGVEDPVTREKVEEWMRS